MLILISWTPSDKRGIYDGMRVRRFVDGTTVAQACAQRDALPTTCTAHVINTEGAVPFADIGAVGKKAVEMFNALAQEGDEPLKCFKHGRDEAERRIGLRIVGIATKSEPIDIKESIKESIMEDTETTEATKPEPKAERQTMTGEFKPVRKSSALGKILVYVFGTDKPTVAGAAEGIGETHEKTLAALKNAKRTNGFLSRVDEHGVLHVSAHGKHHDDFFIATKEPVAKPEGAPRRTKHTELDAVAASGVAPEPLVITSAANMHRQKHADALQKLADDGDWEAVAKFEMKGIDTYSKLINRHRDRLLAAHRAQQQPQHEQPHRHIAAE